MVVCQSRKQMLLYASNSGRDGPFLCAALNRLNQQIPMAQEEHEAEKEEFVAIRKSDLERMVVLLSRLENKEKGFDIFSMV